MTGKFYLTLAAITLFLSLLVACVTTEPTFKTVDDSRSDLSDEEILRKSRVDSVQQINMLDPTKKGLLTKPDTIKGSELRRNG
ncbi:MAG: hypothetical protein ACI837_001722 [Crocinitomicaceae bacterium]|jgi:hypothetical protein